MKMHPIILKKNFLREITKDDLELLRTQKNLNKKFFFYKEDITLEEQMCWYEKYLQREEDWMMISQDETDIIWGIMGCRKLEEGTLDFYNIIRVRNLENTSMKNVFVEFVEYMKLLYPDHNIQVEVLSNNPAISWYERCGFTKTKMLESSVIMNF
jgi:ribosomal protein S18 acetylase RimI-like enzyme